MEKIIKLSGRIDTTNADVIEKSINKEIENFKGQITLDAKELEYISSAGLRIIMRLKKANDLLRVINCNLEVYEIFQMTGFTQIIDISKTLREISVDGCEVIGEGFFGVVYRIDPETIVKVYKKGSSIDSVKREIELARKAFIMGIPTAIPYDIVKVGELYGAVFELINSSSLQTLIKNGTDLDKLAKDTVEVLKKIHSTKLPEGELPSKRKEKIEWVKDCSKLLPEKTANKLLELIEKVPETNTMIHGDFHIKNIMKQNDEIILIDMDTISVGHPIFELGAIYATYEGFASVNKNNCIEFLGISYEQSLEFLNLTYKYYFDGKTQEYIDGIIDKAKIICYLVILWIRSNFMEEGNEIHKQDIEFAKNYLIENVDKIDKLDF